MRSFQHQAQSNGCTAPLLHDCRSRFPNESSVYAAEGTFAHEICEYKVKKYMKERVKRPQSEEYYTEEIDQITDVYAEFVISVIEEMKRNGCEPLVMVEEKVDYSHIAPSGFGTADMLIIGKDGSIQTLHIDAYDRKDETLQGKVDKALGDLDVILSEKISEIDHDLKVADENGHRLTRNRETTAADFVVDAIREEMGTQIAILNGGSVRTALEAGDITKGDLLAILPFENLLSSVKMSGQTILDALEYGSSQTEAITVFDDKPVGEAGSFLQVSGLKYTIDTSVPSPIKVDSDQMFASIEGERRVKDVYVLGEGEYVPIDPEKIYTVSSNNHILMNKGDGYTMFEDCEVLVKNGPVDVSSLINYAKNHNLNDMYLDVEGRITVK